MAPKKGGQLSSFTLGAKWTLNEHVSVIANYIPMNIKKAKATENSPESSYQYANIYSSRLQVSW